MKKKENVHRFPSRHQLEASRSPAAAVHTSIWPAGSSSSDSNSPTELISSSDSESSPASSAASLVAYLATYSVFFFFNKGGRRVILRLKGGDLEGGGRLPLTLVS